MIKTLHEKEKLMKQIVEELQETKELLKGVCPGKDPNELLTAEQISKEYGIQRQTIQKVFQDSELEVQRWTRPFKVKRKIFDKYLDKNHDYLCK